MSLRQDAGIIVEQSIAAVMPEKAVEKALQDLPRLPGRLFLVSFGKAGWSMAKAASNFLQDRLTRGICLTKYGHVKGPIAHVECFQGGHPVVDENGIAATRQIEAMVSHLTAEDTVIVLISGGGSALLEDPLLSLGQLQDINEQLLASGADIRQINAVRKCFSRIKGGQLALLCQPAHVFTVILSDIIGSPLDMIASGPTFDDNVTAGQAEEVIRSCHIQLPAAARRLIEAKKTVRVTNCETHVTASCVQLCQAGRAAAVTLGYKSTIVDDAMTTSADEAGQLLGRLGRRHAGDGVKQAYIFGGETVVKVVGRGLGGRNQQLALRAACEIEGLANVAVFSVGSDGTDGPTDAAGGFVDGSTAGRLGRRGLDIQAVLADNDAYNGLQAADGLLMTGPTGTNVNDLAVVLIGAGPLNKV